MVQCEPSGADLVRRHFETVTVSHLIITGCGTDLMSSSLIWEQEVGGSNPLAPNRRKP